MNLLVSDQLSFAYEFRIMRLDIMQLFLELFLELIISSDKDSNGRDLSIDSANVKLKNTSLSTNI